jgi:hypothetical protein
MPLIVLVVVLVIGPEGTITRRTRRVCWDWSVGTPLKTENENDDEDENDF